MLLWHCSLKSGGVATFEGAHAAALTSSGRLERMGGAVKAASVCNLKPDPFWERRGSKQRDR